MTARLVLLLAFPGVQPLDLVGPHEVFAGANAALAPGRRDDRYELRIVAREPGIMRTESGLGLVATHPLSSRVAPDLLILPGGNGVHAAYADPAIVAWVAKTAARSRRVATVCTGTFLAAAAGLLDGRRAATHWARAKELAAAFPAVDVDSDALYVRSGTIWSSAGVTAGIDLALALLEDDHGPEVAQLVARWMVMFLRRPGGQSQFSEPTRTPTAELDPIRAAQDLIHRDPSADLRVPILAAAANLSVRTFQRVFTADVGEPPARHVERVRVEVARRLLESERTGLAQVARACGFANTETLRRAFARNLGVSPDQYRRRFSLRAS